MKDLCKRLLSRQQDVITVNTPRASLQVTSSRMDSISHTFSLAKLLTPQDIRYPGLARVQQVQRLRDITTHYYEVVELS